MASRTPSSPLRMIPISKIRSSGSRARKRLMMRDPWPRSSGALCQTTRGAAPPAQALSRQRPLRVTEGASTAPRWALDPRASREPAWPPNPEPGWSGLTPQLVEMSRKITGVQADEDAPQAAEGL
jgi:hypothetical protein